MTTNIYLARLIAREREQDTMRQAELVRRRRQARRERPRRTTWLSGLLRHHDETTAVQTPYKVA